MTSRILDGEDWDSLVYSVHSGDCIVMLGPDAVTAVDDGRSVPILDALTRFLQRRLMRARSYINAADYDRISTIADAVVMTHDDDPSQLISWVKEFYAQQPLDDPTLTGLAGLPIRLVINTIPGLPIESAFDPVSVAHYDRHGTVGPLPEWSDERPLVYHLYGSLTDPPSMVLSERHLLDVLVSVIREDPPLPPKLISAIRKPERSFLFLGFRLYDWQLRVLLHVLDAAVEGGSDRQRRSFALEMATGNLDPGTRSFYSSGHGIDFFDAPPDDFMAELVRRVSNEGPAIGSDVAPDSPAVFLCHADEDKEIADELATRLRARQIRTWLDKDDLRGGQRWDPEIERTLRDDVGYVVVLQTRNFVAKQQREQRAYINKELRIALALQEYVSDKRKFLIPVHLDGDAFRADELGALQSIDLSKPDGFERLVSDILRDIQRGQRQW